MHCLKHRTAEHTTLYEWTKGDLSMIRSQDPFDIFTCLIHCRKVLKKIAFCSHYLVFQQMDIFDHTDIKGVNGWWPKRCLSRGLNLVMHTLLEPAQRGGQGRKQLLTCWSSNREDVFKKVIPISPVAVKSKNFAFPLPFNAELWETQSSKRRWSASAVALQLLQAKQEADQGHTGARWIKSHWQGLKNANFRCAIISACDYKPAGKSCGLHWGNPSPRMVIMPMSGIPDSPFSFK